MDTVGRPGPSLSLAHGDRRAILAASLGAALEWYDFFVFGALAAAIAVNFYGNLNSATAFVFALLSFAAGFVIRPLGALVFGRMGDRGGRKRTFLLTILVMGVATTLIGLLPPNSAMGIAAPIALIALRMLQGFSLGGEYGAAATYVAERAPPDRRGEYTSWIQTTSTVGLLLSLAVVSASRWISGPGFDTWGWRIPFLFSGILVVVSIVIRRSLSESPAFARIKSTGRTSKAPLSEAFCEWRNLKLVLASLFGLLAGQAVVWFTALFYSMYFLMQTLKIAPDTAILLVAIALAISTPMYVGFGWLSDRIGRKPVILGGAGLAALTIFPLFHGLAVYGNPGLLEATRRSPVVLVANLDSCSWQFNPLGTSRFTTACDIGRSTLAASGAGFSSRDAAPDQPATVMIGDAKVVVPRLAGLSLPDAVSAERAFKAKVLATLTNAGYPTKADPAKVHAPAIVALLTALMLLGAMTLAPISAALVELFPTRIRYTALSLPYHIGNGYFGGLLPTICFAIVIESGNIFAGLWYPVIVAGLSCVIGLVAVRETYRTDILTKD
jgi:MFS family permease